MTAPTFPPARSPPAIPAPTAVKSESAWYGSPSRPGLHAASRSVALWACGKPRCSDGGDFRDMQNYRRRSAGSGSLLYARSDNPTACRRAMTVPGGSSVAVGSRGLRGSVASRRNRHAAASMFEGLAVVSEIEHTAWREP